MNPDKKLQVWRPLKVGQRIRIRAKYKRGQFGYIKESLDTGSRAISGIARYGVLLDDGSPNTIDYLRHELTRG